MGRGGKSSKPKRERPANDCWHFSACVVLAVETVLAILIAFLVFQIASYISDPSNSQIGQLFAQLEITEWPSADKVALFAAVVTLILGWPIAFRSAYRTAWKQYEYNRSEYVTRQVFDKEYADIQSMSEALYRLVAATVECLDSEQRSPSERFDRARQEVEELLPSMALSLYFTDKNGCVYCGVEKRPKAIWAKKAQQACDTFSDGKAKDMPAKLKCLMETHEKNLHDRAAEIYLLCSYIADNDFGPKCKPLPCGHEGLKQCQSASVCNALTSTDYLRCRFTCFLNCARCRMRSNEMGGKDTRRRNFYDSMPIHRAAAAISRHFDHKCIFDDVNSQVSTYGGVYLVDTKGVFPEPKES